MAFRDREHFIQMVEKAHKEVCDLHEKIKQHIDASEYSMAQMLQQDMTQLLKNAQSISNAFADKYGG